MAAPRLRLRVRLALAGAAVTTVVTLDSCGALTPNASVVLDDTAQLVAGLFAAVACAWMAARTRGVERTWRWLTAVGMAGWSVGQLIWSWYQIFVSTPLPSPAWSDVGYLTLPVFGFAALLTLAVRRRPAVPSDPEHPAASAGPVQPRPVLLLDGLVVVGSVFELTWTTALGAVVHAGAPNRFAFVVAIAYPITDLVMVVMAIQLLTTRPVPAPLRRQVALLGLGLVGLSLSDSIYAYLISSGAARMPPIANVGFVAGPVLVGLAALSPARVPAPPVAKVPYRRRVFAAGGSVHLLLPYLPLAAAGALVLERLATGGHIDQIGICVGVALLVLVVVRQLITLVDNNRLLTRITIAQDELTHQAFHDPLTGLANRSLFADRLAAAVEPDELAVTPMALLFIDLDDFKAVNDRWGHSVGDLILRAAGERLRSCVRGADTVARLGGDEFGVLLVGDADHQAIGERILAALAEPFRVGARSVTVRASIGLAVPDGTGPRVSADGLLRRADTAMYAGKHNGKGSLVRYHPGLSEHPAEPDLAALLAADLTADADGIAGTGLDVVYQPIVSMPDGLLVAVEALIRWSHPRTGPVPATDLVAAAECTGLIGALDNFVLDRACREVAAHRTRHGTAPLIHVNVSASRLGGTDLETTVAAVLRRHGLEPCQLVLEVTESHAIADLGAASRTVRRLRRTGVRLALDDFGTGYNTLIQLDRLPVDIIKIDSRLTAIGPLPSRTETLCTAIIALATRLGVSVIAEGVEHVAQEAALVRSGSRYGQGYLYGRPGPLPAPPAGDRVAGGSVVAATGAE